MNSAGRACCENCGLVLKAGGWEIDHTIPEALIADKSRPLTIEDGKLLGKACCHRGEDGKTARDVGQIAKAVRQEAKHLGIKKSPSFRKPAGMRFDWSIGRYVKESA